MQKSCQRVLRPHCKLGTNRPGKPGKPRVRILKPPRTWDVMIPKHPVLTMRMKFKKVEAGMAEPMQALIAELGLKTSFPVFFFFLCNEVYQEICARRRISPRIYVWLELCRTGSWFIIQWSKLWSVHHSLCNTLLGILSVVHFILTACSLIFTGQHRKFLSRQLVMAGAVSLVH